MAKRNRKRKGAKGAKGAIKRRSAVATIPQSGSGFHSPAKYTRRKKHKKEWT